MHELLDARTHVDRWDTGTRIGFGVIGAPEPSKE
jgi:hypothetical protein